MIPLNTLILTKHVVPQSGLVDLPDVAKGLPDLLGPIIGVLDVVAEVDYDKGFVLAWIITCLWLCEQAAALESREPRVPLPNKML